jgi:hypothetical protein
MVLLALRRTEGRRRLRGTRPAGTMGTGLVTGTPNRSRHSRQVGNTKTFGRVRTRLHPDNANAAAAILGNGGYDVSVAAVDVSSREAVHALVETATGLGDITDLIRCSSPPTQALPATRGIQHQRECDMELFSRSLRAAAPDSHNVCPGCFARDCVARTRTPTSRYTGA